MNLKKSKVSDYNIGVIGLGYVGLPLSIELGKHFNTVGYDLNKKRIKQLLEKNDSNLLIKKKEFNRSKHLTFSDDIKTISTFNIYIICVPTPINKKKEPDLKYLINATKLVSKIIKKNDIVIYESTVYPGVTENICGNILEKKTGLILNKEFFLGYSPERINPGDKINQIKNIKKIISASNKRTLKILNFIYGKIITAGVFQASSIKIAEAAKVIENTQRDVNIALVNELTIIFNKLNIDIYDVLEAASTKWNFIKFKPGFVGGHCIGVDPYYLSFLSKQKKYEPKVILSGRKMNNEMPKIISKEILKDIKSEYKISKNNNKMLIMGFTYKENCRDIRNTKIIDIYNFFKSRKYKIDIFDPWVEKDEVQTQYHLKLIQKPKLNFYDLIIIAVPHNLFKKIGIKKIRKFGKSNSKLYDIKRLFNKNSINGKI